jgi:hypothetical protein
MYVMCVRSAAAGTTAQAEPQEPASDPRSGAERLADLVQTVKTRHQQTGVYEYTAADEKTLRSIIAQDGSIERALSTLAWVLATYDRHQASPAAHHEAVTLARQAFEINANDLANHEILGAAYYSTGDIEAGDRMLDSAIAGSQTEKARTHYTGKKQELRQRGFGYPVGPDYGRRRFAQPGTADQPSAAETEAGTDCQTQIR